MIETIPVDYSGSLLSREFIDKNCTTIFPVRRKTRTLYGIFLELARQLYSDENNMLLGMATLWNADPAKSKIWIDTEYIWEDNTPEFRPAIYIALQGLKLAPVVGQKSRVGFETEEGEAHYAREITGSVTFVHIGQTKGETVNLIDNTYEFFDGLADIIRQDFCFRTFSVTDVTPLKIVKAEKDHLRGEVVAAFSYHDTWSVKLESPKLKKIVLSAGQNLIDLVH